MTESVVRHDAQMRDLIARFSGQGNVIAIQRPYIAFTGSLSTALLLSQIIYWSDRGHSEDGYFYKTYTEWEEEIGLSEYQVRKSATKLTSMGILTTRVKKANGNPTVHYKLKMPEFSESFLKFLGFDGEETSETEAKELRDGNLNFSDSSIASITTESTSKTTTKNGGDAAASLPHPVGTPRKDDGDDDSAPAAAAAPPLPPPEWYVIISGLPGWAKYGLEVGAAHAWLAAKGVPELYAEQTALALKAQWGGKGWKCLDPWSAFRSWVLKPPLVAGSGRGRVTRVEPKSHWTEYPTTYAEGVARVEAKSYPGTFAEEVRRAEPRR